MGGVLDVKRREGMIFRELLILSFVAIATAKTELGHPSQCKPECGRAYECRIDTAASGAVGECELKRGAVIGLIVGFVLLGFLIAMILIICCCCKRKCCKNINGKPVGKGVKSKSCCPCACFDPVYHTEAPRTPTPPPRTPTPPPIVHVAPPKTPTPPPTPPRTPTPEVLVEAPAPPTPTPTPPPKTPTPPPTPPRTPTPEPPSVHDEVLAEVPLNTATPSSDFTEIESATEGA